MKANFPQPKIKGKIDIVGFMDSWEKEILGSERPGFHQGFFKLAPQLLVSSVPVTVYNSEGLFLT